MSKKDETVAPEGDAAVVADQGLVEVKRADEAVATPFASKADVVFGFQEAAERSK